MAANSHGTSDESKSANVFTVKNPFLQGRGLRDGEMPLKLALMGSVCFSSASGVAEEKHTSLIVPVGAGR